MTESDQGATGPANKSLLESAKQGDKAAFDVFYRKHKKNIYIYINKKIPDHYIAEELTQDTFINAYTHLTSYDERGKPLSWLYTIANNLIKNSHRSRAKDEVSLNSPVLANDDNISLMDMLPDAKANTESIMVNEELKKDIEEAMSTLPAGHRQVFVLCDMLGWSYQDVAAFLNCKPTTVGSRLFRARTMIAKRLKASCKNNNPSKQSDQ